MTAREAALKALEAFRRKRAWPDLALGGLTGKHDMQKREAALAARILNGVLQNMALCDHYISSFSSVDLKKIEPRILDILRLSVYQLVFMDRITPSAAVNEGVMLAKKKSNPRAVGFVNAVLRKAAQTVKNGALPEVAGDTIRRLSVGYSHPEWLVGELCGNYGADFVRALLKANNDTDLPVTAQVNTLLTDTEGAISALAADGVEAVRHAWLDDCIELPDAQGIAQLGAFTNGHIWIQDAAARLAVLAAGPAPGDLVIDGCAAPGGKSFAAAVAMGNRGKVYAFDINEAKLRRVAEGADRLGFTIIDAIKRDALAPATELTGKADVVLADVPCSGFGVIRKKPEIRYKSREDIAGLPDIQERILSSLAAYVKQGGVLLYSTCTVLKSENENVIKRFLDRDKRFEAENFSLPGAGNAQDGAITLWPHIHGADGFFICKLRRRN